jgi:hypothetical protein
VSVEQDLIMEAARLARSAPANWDRFIGALQNYSAQSTQNCIQSPLEELQRAQGRAQASARLHALLSDCLASADKIEGKRK